MTEVTFPAPPGDKSELDEADVFTPRFDENGLMPAMVVDAGTGEALMLAYMNAEALALTIATGEAHFWSRSRGRIWRKGESSGNVLRVTELRTDCDQDTLLVRAALTGDGVACHTGRRSCFYRVVEAGAGDAPARLRFSD